MILVVLKRGKLRMVSTVASNNLKQLLNQHELVVCCGSGGVGKTTTSAVLGIEAACQGKRVLVLTIDPAKRLANALGLSELGNEIKQVDLSQLGGDVSPAGALFAMMLDSKRTFDELIERLASNEAAAEHILNNNLYRHLSNAVNGSHEYLSLIHI